MIKRPKDEVDNINRQTRNRILISLRKRLQDIGPFRILGFNQKLWIDASHVQQFNGFDPSLVRVSGRKLVDTWDPNEGGGSIDIFDDARFSRSHGLRLFNRPRYRLWLFFFLCAISRKDWDYLHPERLRLGCFVAVDADL
jgi:hypothetical protein